MTQISSVLALLPAGKAHALAPTLLTRQSITWAASDITNPTTIPSISWSATNLVIVMGVTEDNIDTLNTPTATGLTFTLITSTNTASTTKTLNHPHFLHPA